MPLSSQLAGPPARLEGLIKSLATGGSTSREEAGGLTGGPLLGGHLLAAAGSGLMSLIDRLRLWQPQCAVCFTADRYGGCEPSAPATCGLLACSLAQADDPNSAAFVSAGRHLSLALSLGRRRRARFSLQNIKHRAQPPVGPRPGGQPANRSVRYLCRLQVERRRLRRNVTK